VIAAYLAQDAMEFIRAKKDENILNGVLWLSGFPAPCVDPSPEECRIDSALGAIVHCGGGECSVLKYDSAAKLYGYSAGNPTKFRRYVTLNEIVLGREAQVEVTVSFSQGAVTKKITLHTNMYNTPMN
jgi:hypothetical protein